MSTGDMDEEFIQYIQENLPSHDVEAELYKQGAYAAYDFLMSRWETAMERSRLKEENTPSPQTNGPVMPFGKHKGELLVDIPGSYLRWVLDNLDINGSLRDDIEAIVG